MKQLLLCSIIIFVSVSIRAQSDFKEYYKYNINEEARAFQLGHKLIPAKLIMNDGRGKLFYENPEVTIETMSKSLPVNAIIRVSDDNGNILNDLEVNYNDIDIDLSEFSLHYLGAKRFLVVRLGRYQFFVLNLSNNNLVGPLYSGVEGEASDSQDGTLYFKEVIDDGQYLIGYASNFGMFCYNIADLDNPKLLNHICIDQTHNHQNYFFLDNELNNTYTGLVINNYQNGKYDTVKYIFKGINLEENENGDLIREIYDDRFIRFNKIVRDGNTKELIVDFLNAKIKEN